MALSRTGHRSVSSGEASQTIDSTTAAIPRTYDSNVESDITPIAEQPTQEEIEHLSLDEEMEVIAFDLIELPPAYHHQPPKVLSFDTEEVSVVSNISITPSCAIVPKGLCRNTLMTRESSVSKAWSGFMQAVQTGDGTFTSIAKSGHEAVLTACCGEGAISIVGGKTDEGSEVHIERILHAFKEHNLADDCTRNSSSQQDQEDSVGEATIPVSEASRDGANSKKSKLSSGTSSTREPRRLDMAGAIQDVSTSSTEEPTFKRGPLHIFETIPDNDSLEGNTSLLYGIEMTLEEEEADPIQPCIDSDDEDGGCLSSISTIHEDASCDMVGSMADIATASQARKIETGEPTRPTETTRDAQIRAVKLSYAEPSAVGPDMASGDGGDVTLSKQVKNRKPPGHIPRPRLFKKLKRWINPKTNTASSTDKGKTKWANLSKRSIGQPSKAIVQNSKHSKSADAIPTSPIKSAPGRLTTKTTTTTTTTPVTTTPCHIYDEEEGDLPILRAIHHDDNMPRDESEISGLYAGTVSCEPTIDTYLDAFDDDGVTRTNESFSNVSLFTAEDCESIQPITGTNETLFRISRTFDEKNEGSALTGGSPLLLRSISQKWVCHDDATKAEF